MSLELALIIPDTHRPYHHAKAYALMLKVAKDLKPDHIYVLGDYADFYAVSSHMKDPRLPTMLLKEVESVNEGLDELDAEFPKAKKVFIEGNHEFRLERYLFDKAPALFGITSVKHLLEFDKRSNWRFVPYNSNQLVQVAGSKLYARHEPLGNSAKLTAAKALCSLVYGHIHRIESSFIVGIDGSQHIAFSVGWLGDKRKDEVFGYTKGHQQWQLGFGLVYVDTKTRNFYPVPVHIIESRGKLSCVVQGRLFIG